MQFLSCIPPSPALSRSSIFGDPLPAGCLSVWTLYLFSKNSPPYMAIIEDRRRQHYRLSVRDCPCALVSSRSSPPGGFDVKRAGRRLASALVWRYFPVVRPRLQVLPRARIRTHPPRRQIVHGYSPASSS
jgi:hypothetical protein